VLDNVNPSARHFSHARLPYSDFLAFRRSLPRAPRLERQTVRARGVAFAVFSSPPVPNAMPLVCINGGLLYDHSMLWPALSPLAEGRQIILYDQRGRGASGAPANPEDATIGDDAADLGALRRALGIRQWDVLGHSWGGGIAMLAGAADRAGVRRLVLVDAVGPTSDWMAALRRNVLDRLRGAQREAVAHISEESLGVADAALHSAYSRAVYPAWFVDEQMASHFTPPDALSETGTAVLARLRRDGYDWRDIVHSISAPTLVLHGNGDALPLAVSETNSYIIPNARQIVVPSSGHMPFWEAPRRLFHEVESFLRQ
jgi:proline iminopeptidase